MKDKEILLALVLKHKTWDEQIKVLQKKETIKTDQIQQLVEQCKNDYVTILEGSYPQKMHNSYKPPLVVFYEGDVSLLNNKYIALLGNNDFKLDENEIMFYNKNEHKWNVGKGLKIWISDDDKENHKLVGMADKLVITEALDNDCDDWHHLIVQASIQHTIDFYVKPTISPSMNNGLIKDGANLIDCKEDLEK